MRSAWLAVATTVVLTSAAVTAIAALAGMRGWDAAECQVAALVAGATLAMLALLADITRLGLPASPISAAGEGNALSVLNTRRRLAEASADPMRFARPVRGLDSVRLAMLISGVLLWAGTVVWVLLG